jgi:hypothetical protein
VFCAVAHQSFVISVCCQIILVIFTSEAIFCSLKTSYFIASFVCSMPKDSR